MAVMAVALHWSMANVYGMKPGEVFFTASDIGWVVGHSYIVYAPLLYGCTSVLYEGKPVGTPDAGAYCGLLPSMVSARSSPRPPPFRAIRRDDPEGHFIRRYDPCEIPHAVSRGRARLIRPRCNGPRDQLKIPVIDHWWQTETGWAITANCVGWGRRRSSTARQPGRCRYDLRVLDPSGEAMKPGEIGALCVKLPLPPGSLPTLWQAG